MSVGLVVLGTGLAAAVFSSPFVRAGDARRSDAAAAPSPAPAAGPDARHGGEEVAVRGSEAEHEVAAAVSRAERGIAPFAPEADRADRDRPPTRPGRDRERLSVEPVSPRAPGDSPAAAVRSTVYHVSISGTDTGPGTVERPFRSVRRGVEAAQAGDTIKVHAGTYEGVVSIQKSGAPGAPIVLAGAGDGIVTLTASFDPLPCSETAPTRDRTLRIVQGADHWTIRDLHVVNGIVIMGTNTQVLKNPNFLDRSLPGHGVRDSAAAERILGLFRVDPADFIRLENLDVSGRGVFTSAARHGELLNSRIHDIQCGTGAAVWINRFSHFWTVRGNQVRDVTASAKHWMSEGIRFGSGSSYSLVEDNVVERMNGPGRGITADVGASWNIYRNNRVTDAFVNFSEQLGGWGNQYLSNVSVGARRLGYQVYGEGRKDREPTPKTPRYMRFECNESQGDALDFEAGGVAESSFRNNRWTKIKLSAHLKKYWAQARNNWNGSSLAPLGRVERTGFETCAPPGPRGRTTAQEP